MYIVVAPGRRCGRRVGERAKRLHRFRTWHPELPNKTYRTGAVEPVTCLFRMLCLSHGTLQLHFASPPASLGQSLPVPRKMKYSTVRISFLLSDSESRVATAACCVLQLLFFIIYVCVFFFSCCPLRPSPPLFLLFSSFPLLPLRLLPFPSFL